MRGPLQLTAAPKQALWVPAQLPELLITPMRQPVSVPLRLSLAVVPSQLTPLVLPQTRDLSSFLNLSNIRLSRFMIPTLNTF